LDGEKAVYDLRCYNKTTESLSAEGSMTIIYFDKKKGCSMKIPDEIIKLLQCLKFSKKLILS